MEMMRLLRFWMLLGTWLQLVAVGQESPACNNAEDYARALLANSCVCTPEAICGLCQATDDYHTSVGGLLERMRVLYRRSLLDASDSGCLLGRANFR